MEHTMADRQFWSILEELDRMALGVLKEAVERDAETFTKAEPFAD